MNAVTNHERFLKHLEDSNSVVWAVARWLQERGYTVAVNGLNRAPRHEDWKEYADIGDLSLLMRVEVKGLDASFTGKGDWPYGNHFIVCAKHAWDRAVNKPYAFVYLNREGTHMAIVRRETIRHWYVQPRKDGRYEGVEQLCYLCPTEHVLFRKL